MSTDYFDQVSTNYLQSCELGLHGYFKTKELKRFKKTILKYYPEIYEGKLVDVGCGPGFYSRELSKTYNNIHFTGVDSSLKMIELYRKLGYRGVHSDLESLAQQSIEFFDILLVCGVMEFVKDINRFCEALRVLSRKESLLFVIIPRLNALSLGYYFHHKTKSKIYMRHHKEYTKSLEKHGFKQIEEVNLTVISKLLVLKIGSID